MSWQNITLPHFLLVLFKKYRKDIQVTSYKFITKSTICWLLAFRSVLRFVDKRIEKHFSLACLYRFPLHIEVTSLEKQEVDFIGKMF